MKVCKTFVEYFSLNHFDLCNDSFKHMFFYLLFFNFKTFSTFPEKKVQSKNEVLNGLFYLYFLLTKITIKSFLNEGNNNRILRRSRHVLNGQHDLTETFE